MEKTLYIDLNSDLGESFGNYKISGDADIIRLASSVNIACGCHAGDPVVMDRTVALVKEAGIQLGAHPGYPDMQGFGRRNMALSPEEVRAYVIYQVGALDAFCKTHGVKLQHVKPHGALYNTAAVDADIAGAIVKAVKEVNPELIIMGIAGGELIRTAREEGMKTAEEFFADRAYEEDGTLRNRRYDDAMITNEDDAVKRAIRVIREGKLTSITGKEISLRADTICVHGDGAKAIEFVKKIRDRFEKEGIRIAPLKDFI